MNGDSSANLWVDRRKNTDDSTWGLQTLSVWTISSLETDFPRSFSRALV